jgi:hypothetical protein
LKIIILNKSNKKDGVKLITKLNLQAYDKSYDDFIIKEILNSKYQLFFELHFNILKDFAFINENTYNILMSIMIGTKKNIIHSNNDDTIPLNEEEDEDNHNQKIKQQKKMKVHNNTFKNEIHLSTDEKNKILTLLHTANLKNFQLSKDNEELMVRIFGKQLLLKKNIKIEKYSNENDKEKLNESSYITINKKKQKIIFIDDINSLKLNFKYFANSKYIGIDAEWTQPMSANIKEDKVSILQIANESETCALIIDLLKFKNDEKFLELFKKYFKKKIFVGFNFNNSDIEQMGNMKNIFNEFKIVDLIDIYQYKYFEKAGSLANICEKICGKKLNKDEQCSNWDLRPLRPSQINYAAIDALICVKLYKILYNSH